MDQLDPKEFYLTPRRTPLQHWYKANFGLISALLAVFAAWFCFDVIWSYCWHQEIFWINAVLHSLTTTGVAWGLYKAAQQLASQPNFAPIKILRKPNNLRRIKKLHNIKISTGLK